MGSPAFVNRVHGTLKSLNCDGRLGVMLAGAPAVLLLLPTLAGEPGRALLRYDRAGLAHGQWWRLRDGARGSSGSAACAAQQSRSRPHVGAVRPGLLAEGVDSHRARRHGGHRCGPVARRFDRAVVRGFLGRPAWGHGRGRAGARAQRASATAGCSLALLAVKLAWEHWVGRTAVLGQRRRGRRCASLRGARRRRHGRVPEAARQAAIIRALLASESSCPSHSCSPVRARSRSACSGRSPQPHPAFGPRSRRLPACWATTCGSS